VFESLGFDRELSETLTRESDYRVTLDGSPRWTIDVSGEPVTLSRRGSAWFVTSSELSITGETAKQALNRFLDEIQGN